MKLGKEKLAYGMSAKKAAALAAIGQNDETRKQSAALSFFNFTRAYVSNARDLARSGKKDVERDWHRYFQNARVVEMLAANGACEASTLQKLESEIKELGFECHPEDVPDWSTDIAAIRACLEKVVKNLPVSSPVGPSPSLSVRGHPGQNDIGFNSERLKRA